MVVFYIILRCDAVIGHTGLVQDIENNPTPSQCSTPTLDEWSAFATFLADVIEKYASVLEIDKAESLSNNENQQDVVDTTIAA